MTLRILYVLYFLVFVCQLNAQTCCTAGAPISSFLEVNSKDEKSTSLQFLYEYKSIDLLIDNNKRIKNDPRSRFGQNLGLKLDYTYNTKWAFSAIIPVVHQSRSTISETESSIGIGDLSLIFQYMIFEDSRNAWNFSVGAKLPTGKVAHRVDSGIFLSPDMQSGTGSYDFLVRSSFVRTRFVTPLLNANMSLVYKKNGFNSDFGSTENFGGRSFAFGDEALMIAGLRYLLDHKLGFLIPDLSLKFRWGGPNQEQSTMSPNSGGQWLSVPIGFSFVNIRSTALRLYGEIPLYQNLEGLQISTNFLVGLQLSYLFKNKNTDELIDF